MLRDDEDYERDRKSTKETFFKKCRSNDRCLILLRVTWTVTPARRAVYEKQFQKWNPVGGVIIDQDAVQRVLRKTLTPRTVEKIWYGSHDSALHILFYTYYFTLSTGTYPVNTRTDE